MKLQDALFQGKSDEDRVKIHNLFRDVLANSKGHELMHLVTSARSPLASRFAPGRSNEEAAFLDGQLDAITTFLTLGTNLGVAKPDDK